MEVVDNKIKLAQKPGKAWLKYGICILYLQKIR